MRPVHEDEVIKAGAGEIEILLSETPTSGYRWKLAQSPPEVRLVAEETVLEQPRQTLAGGQAAKRFRVQVDQRGSFELLFHLAREWESEPIKVHRTRLVVS